MRYLVDKLLAPMPTVIGGRFKTLKTLIMTDLILSMSSGTQFLNRWNCQQVRVGVWSGESGRLALQNAQRRICRARGIKPADCNLDWHFSLPPLYSAKDLVMMAEIIKQKNYGAIFIDPAYLCLLDSSTATRAGNVFVMGAALAPLTEVGQSSGCLVGLCHHFGKWTDSNTSNTPAELGELSQSGMAEWARQWVLLSRRSAYQHDGRHSLYMTAGGSLGQSYQLAVDVDEGDMNDDGLRTEWKVIVKGLSQAQVDDKLEKTAATAAAAEKKILEALAGLEPMTPTDIAHSANIRKDDKFDDLLRALAGRGVIKAAKVLRANKQEYDGYQLA